MSQHSGRKIVTAAIIRQDGAILLARRLGGPHSGRWELPGGKVEPGETDQQCLARELREELGIETDIGPLFAESLYRYETGEILLRAFETTWRGGEIRLDVHDRIAWARPHELGAYDLLPADVPIAAALARR